MKITHAELSGVKGCDAALEEISSSTFDGVVHLIYKCSGCGELLGDSTDMTKAEATEPFRVSEAIARQPPREEPARQVGACFPVGDDLETPHQADSKATQQKGE